MYIKVDTGQGSQGFLKLSLKLGTSVLKDNNFFECIPKCICVSRHLNVMLFKSNWLHSLCLLFVTYFFFHDLRVHLA